MPPRKSPARSAAFLEAKRRNGQNFSGPHTMRGRRTSSFNAFWDCPTNLNVAPPSWRLRCRLEAGVTTQIRTAPVFLSLPIRKSNRKGEAYEKNTNTKRKCKLMKNKPFGPRTERKIKGAPKMQVHPDKCMKNKARNSGWNHPVMLLKRNDIGFYTPSSQ